MRKKTTLSILVALFVLSAGGFAGTALAADATAAVDFASAYVWRGITFNDGLVAQPSIDVASGGFGINVWGNLDIDDYDNTLEDGEFSEIDLTLSYGFSADPVDITVGYIEYLFPAGGAGTREIFLSLGMELAPGLSAGIDGYYDVDEVEDYYASVSLGYSHELDGGFSIGAGASVGIAGDDFTSSYTESEDGGLHEYVLSVDCGYAVTDAVGLSAFVAYTDTFDEDVLPEQDTDVFGGVGISCTF